MRRVLITRPEPGASRTASKVRELGWTPLVLPLTRIEPLPDLPTVDAANYAALALTSPNSARYLPAAWAAPLKNLPAYAVGAATAATARSAGLNVVDEGAGDAAGLCRVIAEHVKPGSRILVLCGRVRRSVLEKGLSGTGFLPHLVETYDTLPTSPSANELANVLGRTPVDAVLLYSAVAANEFTRCVERVNGRELFGSARFIAISSRIGAQLPSSWAERLVVAAEPNEEAMLSLL